MSTGRPRQGHPEGTEPLAAVPSLDALVAEPERAAALPYRALLEARRTAQRLVADLDMVLALAGQPVATTAPQDSQDPSPLLSPDQAAAFLGRSRRWIRRTGRLLPGRVPLGKRSISYRRADLERYIRQRAEG
jgi:hypothetical protein